MEKKFKAWDKTKNRWYEECFFVGHNGTVYIHDFIIHRGLEPVQYIGIKDKDGIEIYEGDIVSFKLFPNESEIKAKVSWDKTGWSFFNNKNQFVDTIPNLHRLSLFPKQTELKRIGNIYENPDLLKDS